MQAKRFWPFYNLAFFERKWRKRQKYVLRTTESETAARTAHALQRDSASLFTLRAFFLTSLVLNTIIAHVTRVSY